MNEQAIRFRFGIFVLAALILLAVLTILFGGFPNYFKRTDDYTIVFTNAQGVAPGTPVRRSGVRIGEVRNITLDNETGKVNVEIRVDGKYSLRKVDRPMLQVGLLGGDASISFVPPENPKLAADTTPVRPGAVIEGVTPADAGLLMQKTADLVQPAQEAVVEIKKVFQTINEMTPLVKETLVNFNEIGKIVREVGPEIGATARQWKAVGERADLLLNTNEKKINESITRAEEALRRVNSLFSDENQKLVQDTLRNAKKGSDQFELLAKDTSELIKDTRVTVKQVNETLKKADAALEDFQKAMKPFSEKSPSVLKNVDEATENLNKSLKDIRELVQVIARSDGTVQRLISDPALYNNLNDSAVMVTKILPRLDRILRDMEVFSDKLARHPELLGLRGAIVPSIGLKESPSVIPYRVYP
jgi:phospholipid/cholesterol/gamma-HCH transport system substrate-binding protein